MPDLRQGHLQSAIAINAPIINAAITVLYSVIVLMIVSGEISGSYAAEELGYNIGQIIGSVIGACVYLPLVNTYFKKRADMFVN